MTLAVGANPASADGFQLPQAVTYLSITPHGTSINVLFHLRYAAVPTVALRKADDLRPLGATPYKVAIGRPKTAWSIDVTGLKPNTGYPLQISEPGTASRAPFVYNNADRVWTQHRRVIVSVEKVMVANDGNPAGCGSFALDADLQPGADPDASFGACDGDAVWYPEDNITLEDAPASFPWPISIWDWDTGQAASAPMTISTAPSPDGYEGSSREFTLQAIPTRLGTLQVTFLVNVFVGYHS